MIKNDIKRDYIEKLYKKIIEKWTILYKKKLYNEKTYIKNDYIEINSIQINYNHLILYKKYNIIKLIS